MIRQLALEPEVCQWDAFYTGIKLMRMGLISAYRLHTTGSCKIICRSCVLGMHTPREHLAHLGNTWHTVLGTPREHLAHRAWHT